MLVPSATTNLVSCKPDCQSAGPHSWWAGGCEGTGIPSLGRKTSHTSGARRCRSLGGNAPAGPCSSTRTWSRKRWQTPPMSGPVELRPRERLWPACRHQSNTSPVCGWWISLHHQLLTNNLTKFLMMVISATYHSLSLNKNVNFRCVEFQTSLEWMEWITPTFAKGFNRHPGIASSCRNFSAYFTNFLWNIQFRSIWSYWMSFKLNLLPVLCSQHILVFQP